MPVVQHDVLRQFTHDIFSAVGIPPEDARIVSDHLVNSHLAGHDSHGTWFVPNYARSMKSNYPLWENRKVIREGPTLQIIDGKGANGIVSCTHAVDIAVEKASSAAFGFVGLRNLTHIGRLGDFPPRIAERGMLGMVWLNGGGLFLAPFGSADRKLRPEPIAFAAPRRDAAPFMLDMTMTVVAGGKIEQKIIREEPLPKGWLVDKQGDYVTDANCYRDAQANAVLPLGGLQFGHKGYGLAMMVEMLVGPLSHAGCTKGNAGGGGVMVLAIDIEAFTDLGTYIDEVEGLRDWVCSARPLPGVERIYAPGELEEETKQRRINEGIDLPTPTWKEICKVANEMGVDIPAL